MQIVYVSSIAPGVGAEALDDIAAQAHARSAAARLTGLLLRRDRYLYAILEGPRRRVLQRIEEIVAGRSERGLKILREVPVETRRFSNWTFGSLPASASDVAGPDEFLWSFCGLLGHRVSRD